MNDWTAIAREGADRMARHAAFNAVLRDVAAESASPVAVELLRFAERYEQFSRKAGGSMQHVYGGVAMELRARAQEIEMDADTEIVDEAVPVGLVEQEVVGATRDQTCSCGHVGRQHEVGAVPAACGKCDCPSFRRLQ